MSTSLHVGALMGLLMACVVLFASYEIYSDVLLLEEEEETTRCLAAAEKTVAATGPPAANTGYLVFFSEFSPKTNRRRDRMGFYMRQFGADGTLPLIPPSPGLLRALSCPCRVHRMLTRVCFPSAESFFGPCDQVHRQGVARALDELFSSTQGGARKIHDASSPLLARPL